MSSPKSIRCVILGGGGNARVLIDCLSVAGISPYAVLDADRALWGKELLGIPVRGDDVLLVKLRDEGASHFIVGLGGVGDNRPRRRLFELGLSHGLAALSVQHPSACCSRHVKIGNGTMIFPGAVINVGAVIGDNVIMNTGVLVDHDCIIGDHVHIAPGAVLSGTVRVGHGAHIGAGATVRQEIVIGDDAIVGAGSVVVKDVPARTTVKGIPAR